VVEGPMAALDDRPRPGADDLQSPQRRFHGSSQMAGREIL
jgi:hypothetical protein